MDRRRVGGAIALALVAAFLVWLLLIRDDSEEPAGTSGTEATTVEPFGPAFVGERQLREAAQTVGHPVYWAGPDQDGEPELTVTTDGRVFLRYITGEEGAGVQRADFLTVATYSVANAEEALQEVAGREGRESFELPDGGLAVVDTANPERVYFVPSGSGLQVEVFHPQVGVARELVETNEIEQID
jgi:hypothetical protein